ncbi:N-acetylglucosamine-6-phosphate deacetylase [bacterium D16-51]|nr:N-acetylglucosamine-6-phosphate deacetylase [bacterium D16-59]RKI59311.1 N-acetylglucosamine-6-phosphate deacetylase [bacterium D16-51]
MVIENIKIYTKDYKFIWGKIVIKNGMIEALLPKDGIVQEEMEIWDGQGCFAIPGMTDLHFHGCNGYDFCDGTVEALDEMAKYQASAGVTTIAPAVMTLPVPDLEKILSAAAAYKKMQEQEKMAGRADFVGINMEGPFISLEKKGAQNGNHIIECDVGVYRKLQKAAGGLVKIIAVAPEIGDALSFISTVKNEVTVSIAHSNADYETAKRAIGAGAAHITHLFNGMSGFHHREPGIIGAAADSDFVTAELICDGQHIHPAVIRAVFRLFGRERIILISDSMRAAGLQDGTYTLGGQKVLVSGGRAVMADGKTLAGSVSPLSHCVKYLVRQVGIPLEDAVYCAAVSPVKRLGLNNQHGSLAKGKKADIVLLDQDINVVKVIKDGIFI